MLLPFLCYTKSMDDDKIISKLAEYLSIVPRLSETDPPELYRRANQLALELAMVLPPSIYESIGPALKGGNIFDVIFKARKEFGHSSSINPDSVFLHWPGAGK